MSDEVAHYFTTPTGHTKHREIEVVLAGRRVTVSTAGGVFSSERIDAGTRVLLARVPDPPARGDVLDLGCGWGPIAMTLGLLSPGATVWAVDANDLALELTRDNAARLGLTGVRAVRPDEVPDEVTFSAIWSNPPIRVGKDLLHDLLARWLPRLAGGASAHLVVQRNLGADSLHRWLAESVVPGLGPWATVERVGSAKGYRVLRVGR
ncbi:MAG: methyltransferase [Actinomycetales bacterium]|nr:methyltransferase [Actinomycetales bacterium]